MQVILNIGLDHPGGRHLPHWVTAAARLAWFKVTGAHLVQSDSEPTLVLTVEDNEPGLDNRIDELAKTLKQDCIAVWYPEESWGMLIGPKAAEWGNFNPAFFFMPDGKRLG